MEPKHSVFFLTAWLLAVVNAVQGNILMISVTNRGLLAHYLVEPQNRFIVQPSPPWAKSSQMGGPSQRSAGRK